MWGKIKSLKNKKLLISSLGALSFFSSLTVLGGLIGYFSTKWFLGRYLGRGFVKSIVFKIGKYRFHFHHWLTALGFLLLGIFDILPFLGGVMVQGIIMGVAFQDIFDYSDWRRVVEKIS